MTNNEAAALKVGDKVVYVSGGGFGGSRVIMTVVRRTATQIVLDSGKRINRNGDIVGQSAWSQSYVRPWTPEVAAAMELNARRVKALNTINDVRRWAGFTVETLEAIAALVEGERQRQTEGGAR